MIVCCLNGVIKDDKTFLTKDCSKSVFESDMTTFYVYPKFIVIVRLF